MNELPYDRVEAGHDVPASHDGRRHLLSVPVDVSSRAPSQVTLTALNALARVETHLRKHEALSVHELLVSQEAAPVHLSVLVVP